MNVVYFMAPLALLLSMGFVGAFIWATRNGQWDDMDLTPKKLMEDEQHHRAEGEQHNRPDGEQHPRGTE